MRIHNYRPEDMSAIVQIHQAAAEVDGYDEAGISTLEAWLATATDEVIENTFVVADDDDELNTWSQAGTLDGVQGEIVGYTSVHLQQDHDGYHLLCQGAVHPKYRRQNAGRILLVGALNRARILATEFEFEAEQEGKAIYFEALLPLRDEASPRLATKCEMQPTDLVTPTGMQLYRRDLWQ